MTKAESTRTSQRASAKAPAQRRAKTAVKPQAKRAVRSKAAAAVDESSKTKKTKLVRDSFTMPEAEYELLSAMKKRCLAKGLAAKKSEVLRTAVIGLAAKTDAALLAALKALPVVKTGRPPKGKK